MRLACTLYLLVLISCTSDSRRDFLEFPEGSIAHHFDFPVGDSNAKGYYNAQVFGENDHLGDDWNGTGGGDSDLGDPIYSIANGYVVNASDMGGGWGKVVRIIHELPNGENIESVYAHCQEMFVEEGDWISKGEKIASIGTANGSYLAHLHFEIRDRIGMPIGGGYGDDIAGYLNPTAFIRSHR